MGRFEAGAVAPTFGTVRAVSLAFSKALTEAEQRGVDVDGPVTLAELVQSTEA